MADEARKPGRPKLPIEQTIRTPQIADKIIAWISEGKTLRQFCREHPIKKSSVYAWLDEDLDFAGRFARARKLGFCEIAEECLEIADTPQEGVEVTTKASGIEEKRGDMLGHRKLQIETRLKLLAKWDPGRFGEKLQLAGADDLPPLASATDEQLDARILALQAKLYGDKGGT